MVEKSSFFFPSWSASATGQVPDWEVLVAGQTLRVCARGRPRAYALYYLVG